MTGRIAFPDVVTYAQENGVEHSHPPRNGKPWRLNVKDIDAYEDLARTGLLYCREHVGEAGEMVDNRRTS